MKNVEMTKRGARLASSYAKGGGGTVLEHLLGASAFTSLLTGGGFQGLPTDARLISVRFQADAISPVDDLVLTGRDGERQETNIAIGIRRNPTIGSSDKKFVKLVADMLRLLDERDEEIDRGTWRIGLAVAGPHKGARELQKLTSTARSQMAEAGFVEAVAGERRELRERYRLFTEVVAAASQIHSPKTSMASWRLLKTLRVVITQLEDDPNPEMTQRIDSLRPLTPWPSKLWGQLRTLAADDDKKGGCIDEGTLRASLRDFGPIKAHPASLLNGPSFRSLARRLRQRTARDLVAGRVSHRLPRAEAKANLQKALKTAKGPVLVSGAPDVGKSALTTEVLERLESSGEVAVVWLSLRDLPPTLTELDESLGSSIDEALGGAPVAPQRMILIDGAEAASEGSRTLFEDLVRVATTVGLVPVVVTRSDAKGVVRAGLEVSAPEAPIKVCEVQPLDDAEIDEIVGVFPALARVAKNPRAKWLLGRLRFVQSLLRSGVRAELESELACEAAVFDIAWQKLVRRDEETSTDRVSPDERDSYLRWLAHRELDVAWEEPVPPSRAAGSLRSSGLLLPPARGFAWKSRDEFADDLVRDFAVARALLVAGHGLLADAGGPRWAIRAARIACQAAILVGANEPESPRRELSQQYDEVASQHGARWSDLVLEAVLTLGNSRAELAAAADEGLCRDARWVGQLLRIVLQRHAESRLIVDPEVGRPVIELLLDRFEEIPHRNSDISGDIKTTVIGWLLGMRSKTQTDALRVRIRGELLSEHLLQSGPRINAISLLGPDLNDKAANVLKEKAQKRPHGLHHCVEQVLVPQVMASYQPDLLVDLAEAYYIEEERPDAPRYGRGVFDDGIRNHRSPFGTPQAAWYLGPFRWMLEAQPRRGLAMIQRLLNTAARHRAHSVEQYGTQVEYRLWLPSAGEVLCYGDSHVWCWYRGTSVGPYPAMSALMAVERFADRLVAIGFPLSKIVEFLLEGCENLAMPGLVFGLLVRHLDSVGDELDQWLSNPQVWHLEFNRAVAEHSGIRWADDSGIVGAEHREENPHHLVQRLMARAVSAKDEIAIQRLGEVADALVSHPSIVDEEERITIEGWAVGLRWDQYRVFKGPDGIEGAFPMPPPAVVERMVEEQPVQARQRDLLQLSLEYRLQPEKKDSDQIERDLKLLRELENEPLKGEMLAVTALSAAATALEAVAADRLELDDETGSWCVDRVLRAAFEVAAQGPRRGHWLPDEVIRAVCDGVGALSVLAKSTEEAEVLRPLVAELGSSEAGKIRLNMAQALRGLWNAPCDARDATCHHRIALEMAVAAGSRIVLPAPGDHAGELETLSPFSTEALSTIHPRNIAYYLLPGPIVALANCAASECCVARDAAGSLGLALEAYTVGAEEWGEEGPPYRQAQHFAVTAALLELPSNQTTGLLSFLVSLDEYPCSQASVLRDVRLLATTSPQDRKRMREAWPEVMRYIIGNGPTEEGTHRNLWDPFVEVIPAPVIEAHIEDIDALLLAASDGWPACAEFREFIEDWLPTAPRSASALNALVGFIRIQPVEDQIRVGLPWVGEMVGSEWPARREHPYLLLPWLTEVRDEIVKCGGDYRRIYLRILDAMAAGGDTEAARLQEREE